MQSLKKKQKTVDKDFQDDIKQVKGYLSEGKSLVEKASSSEDFWEGVDIFTKAIMKASSIQVSNSYLLHYYRGLCYLNLKQHERAERDFMEGISLADEKGKSLIYNSLGRCYVQMTEKDSSYLEQAIKSYQKSIEYNKNTDGEPHLKLAQIYRKIKDNIKAIKYYSSSIKFLKPSQQYQAYIERGLCYRQINQLSKSNEDFIKACQIKKDQPYCYFNLGVNYLLEFKYEQSLEKIDIAIQLNGDEPQYKNYKGLALYMSGQYDACLEISKETIKLYHANGIENSEVGQCYYNQGNAYYHLHMLDDALNSYKAAHSFDIKDEQRLKIYYAQGLTLQNLKNIQAISKFQLSLLMIGDNKDNDLYLSTLYHLATNKFANKKYSEAVKDINRIVDEGCYDKCVYELRGKIYLEDQKYQLSLKDFQTVLSLDSNYPDVYYYLGMAKSNLGQINQAISDFFKAIELGSRNILIMNGISFAYLKVGKPDKALVYVNCALQKQPKNQDFLIQRSMVYLELGENQKGIQDLSNALIVNKQNPLIYYRRGLCYYKSKIFQQAIEDLNKSLNFNPSQLIEPDIYYLIGVSFASRQQFSNAIDPLSKAIKLKKLPKYYHERAKCYILLDQNKEALDDLNQVIAAQPTNAFAYFRRGLVYKALKMYEQSAQNFMKARELSPDDPKLILNKKQIYQIKYRKLCEPGEEE